MAGLRLNLDPTGIVTGGAQAESALEQVKREALETEQALTRAGTKGGAGVARMGQAATQASGVMQRYGSRIQQAGYQVGDFAVQVGSGGSALVAFSQQGSQVLGAFGPWGAVLGAALAVTLPLAGALWNAGEAAGTMSERLKTAYEDVRAATTDLQAQIDKLRFGVDEEYQVELLQEQLRIRREISENIGRGQSYLASTTDSLDRQQMVVAEINAETEALAAKHNEITSLLADQENRAVQLAISQGVVEQRAGETAARMGEADRNARLLAGVDIASGVNDAVASASQLVKKYGMALGLATALAGLGLGGKAESLMDDGRGSQREGRQGAIEFNSARSRAAAYANAAKYQARLAGTGGNSGGSGGGGGKSAIDESAEDYDRLVASLDPAIRAQQEFAQAQEIVNAALKSGKISSEEAAKTLAMARKEMEEASGAAGTFSDFIEIGGSAIDRLIEGTTSLKEVWRDVVKEIAMAVLKKQLLGNIQGGTSSDSIGTLIAKGLFGGLLDSGGTLPMGQWGIVGERGPEIVRSTAAGAVVTSRMDTARQMQSGGVVSGEIGVSVDDDGKIQAYVKRMGVQAAQAGATQAVRQVRQNWGAFGNEYSMHGALV